MAERSYLSFGSRKLHSLLGVIPLGIFLLEHIFMNSMAILGEDNFNQAVEFLHSVPLLWVLEIFVIALPLSFHAILGMKFVIEGKNNVLEFPTFRNWMFFLQRLSGVVIFAFLIFHLYTLRFQTSELPMYLKVAEQLANPLTLAFYLAGITAATFHFANGLWGFLINWGILTGTKSQKYFGYLMLVLFLCMNVLGVRMVLAFV